MDFTSELTKRNYEKGRADYLLKKRDIDTRDVLHSLRPINPVKSDH